MTSSYCFIYSETSKFRVTDEEVFDALDAYDSSFMEHSQTFPTAGLLPVGSARAVPAIPVPLPGDADVCLFHRLQDPLPRWRGQRAHAASVWFPCWQDPHVKCQDAHPADLHVPEMHQYWGIRWDSLSILTSFIYKWKLLHAGYKLFFRIYLSWIFFCWPWNCVLHYFI